MHTVAKLIDTSLCIGCKACEVACQQWNDQEYTLGTFNGTYQTQPDLTHNFWNLIKFNEYETDGQLSWLMSKYQCGAGLPEGMSGAGRDRAECQRHRRFCPRKLHRVRILYLRLSVRCTAAES